MQRADNRNRMTLIKGDDAGLGGDALGSDAFSLTVVAGPDKGCCFSLTGDTCVIGTSPACSVMLHDPLVADRHLRLKRVGRGWEIRDLGSPTGSYFHGARIAAITVESDAVLAIGQSTLRIQRVASPGLVGPFARLAARSPAIRDVFEQLERLAASDVAVLLCGETGTGKEVVAELIHEVSARRDRPFVVCDLSAIRPTLLESELFGHRRGAFTSAEYERRGAFLEADGGTIFLDEVGELGADVQPRLLRVLERRAVKAVGTDTYRDVDVRIIAATNRDLSTEVQAGRFRADLYHRLAVACIRLPPLRERAEDIELLAGHLLAQLAEARGVVPPTLSAGALRVLTDYQWPGNIRELRNALERAMSLAGSASVLEPELFDLEARSSRPEPSGVSFSLGPFKQSKDRLLAVWERSYLEQLLEQANGNVSLAAQRAGLARAHLHRLLLKHGVRHSSQRPPNRLT
jgi:two-component system nitrogen regulation response regulator GlnG